MLRAAKRPAILRKNDTTLEPGCTPEQKERLHLRQLVPARHQARKGVCAGRLPPRKPKQNLYADGYKPPQGAKPKAVRVNPGTVLVQARPVESADRQGHAGLAEQLVRAQRRPGAERLATSPTRSRASTKAAAAASRTSPSASPRTARASSSRSPRKSPSAARKRSCRASPRKRRCSTSRSCSTAS